MAKDKNKEAIYKAEGLRRMKERKAERKRKYISLIEKFKDLHLSTGCSLASVKHNAPWKDWNSPTGWRQICSYRGTCQFPCNGDC